MYLGRINYFKIGWKMCLFFCQLINVGYLNYLLLNHEKKKCKTRHGMILFMHLVVIPILYIYTTSTAYM